LSTKANPDRWRFPKENTDWFNWVEPYYIDLDRLLGDDYEGVWELKFTD